MGFKKAFTSTIKRVSALAGAVALSDGPEPGPADLIGAAVEVGGFGAAIWDGFSAWRDVKALESLQKVILEEAKNFGSKIAFCVDANPKCCKKAKDLIKESFGNLLAGKPPRGKQASNGVIATIKNISKEMVECCRGCPPFWKDKNIKGLRPAADGKGGYLDDRGRRYLKGDKKGEWHVHPNDRERKPLWDGREPRDNSSQPYWNITDDGRISH